MRSVDLIDTPGLVDGNVNYPFDVNRIIAEMAEIVDLILVFLDPIGQALCSRTMNVVADLNVRARVSACAFVGHGVTVGVLATRRSAGIPTRCGTT
jgi:GTP1/Obg family GTP-binding protein